MNALYARQTLGIYGVIEIHINVTFKKSQECHFRLFFFFVVFFFLFLFDSEYILMRHVNKYVFQKLKHDTLIKI